MSLIIEQFSTLGTYYKCSRIFSKRLMPGPWPRAVKSKSLGRKGSGHSNKVFKQSTMCNGNIFLGLRTTVSDCGFCYSYSFFFSFPQGAELKNPSTYCSTCYSQILGRIHTGYSQDCGMSCGKIRYRASHPQLPTSLMGLTLSGAHSPETLHCNPLFICMFLPGDEEPAPPLF